MRSYPSGFPCGGRTCNWWSAAGPSCAFGADTNVSRHCVPFDVVDVEDDALTLPQVSEDASAQGCSIEQDFGSVRVAYDDAESGGRIEEFDHALHRPSV